MWGRALRFAICVSRKCCVWKTGSPSSFCTSWDRWARRSCDLFGERFKLRIATCEVHGRTTTFTTYWDKIALVTRADERGFVEIETQEWCWESSRSFHQMLECQSFLQTPLCSWDCCSRWFGSWVSRTSWAVCVAAGVNSGFFNCDCGTVLFGTFELETGLWSFKGPIHWCSC